MFTGFSLSETLPWNKKVMTKFFTPRRHLYGSSAGFKPANVKDYPYMVSLDLKVKHSERNSC